MEKVFVIDGALKETVVSGRLIIFLGPKFGASVLLKQISMPHEMMELNKHPIKLRNKFFSRHLSYVFGAKKVRRLVCSAAALSEN